MSKKSLGIRLPDYVYNYVTGKAVRENRTTSNMIATIILDSMKRTKGAWLRMTDLSEDEDDRYQCSNCRNVVHWKKEVDLYTFNGWCGRCGSDNNREPIYF